MVVHAAKAFILVELLLHHARALDSKRHSCKESRIISSRTPLEDFGEGGGIPCLFWRRNPLYWRLRLTPSTIAALPLVVRQRIAEMFCKRTGNTSLTSDEINHRTHAGQVLLLSDF